MTEPFLLSALSMLAALGCVLAIAWVVLRLLRGRLGGGASGARGGSDADALRFVRTLQVGTRERVVLVEHRGERFMLGVAAGNVQLLHRFSAESTPMPRADARVERRSEARVEPGMGSSGAAGIGSDPSWDRT